MDKNQAPEHHLRDRVYKVTIAFDDTESQNKTITISLLKLQCAVILLFALLVVIVCYVVYSSITISSLRSVIELQQGQINTLYEEKSTLEINKTDLESEVKQLSRAITQKVATENTLAAEDEEQRMPTGIPLSGTSSISSAMDDPDSADMPAEASETEDGETAQTVGNPITLFKAASGALVIASGKGVVTDSSADPKFGNSLSIDHGNGYVSIYRNAGTALVHEGDEVHRGDILYIMDDSNIELGYQLTHDGEYIDPQTMIEING